MVPVPNVTSTQPKKHRSDEGWRDKRAVKRRDSKIKEPSQEIEKLAGKKATQASRMAKALSRAQEAEHVKHIDSKASREMLL